MEPTAISAIEVLEQAPTFVRGLLDELARRGIDVSTYPIDHVCCRAGSQGDYVRLCSEFRKSGAALLSETLISGRMISTFRLARSIVVDERKIPLIEIPAPKATQSYATGLEHCEFVVGSDLADFSARHPRENFDTRGLQKTHNPELVLSLGGGRSVKFHPLALDEVIVRENAE